MSIRTRRKTSSDHGYAIDDGWRYSEATFLRLDEICTDESPYTGPGHTFSVERWRCEGSVYNGTNGAGYVRVNTPTASLANRNYPDISYPDRPSLNGLAAKLLARTNPSKPSVDLPAFIGELKDLPHLLHLAGKNLIQKMAATNLKYQFEIKPLVSDLSHMLNFQKEVAKRVSTLKKLKETGRLSYKQDLYENTSTWDKFDGIAGVPMMQASYVRIWGQVVWSLTGTLPETDEELHALAVRATYGLYANFATIWELVPWSWLVDWFTNVGDILNAGRNLLPVQNDVPLIMVHDVASASTAGKQLFGFLDLSPGLFMSERKTRQKVPAALTAELPFLTARQLSILGSIRLLSRR